MGQTSSVKNNSVSMVNASDTEANYPLLLLQNTQAIVLVLDKKLLLTLYNNAAAQYVKTYIGVVIKKGMHLSQLVSKYTQKDIIAVYNYVLEGHIQTLDEEIEKDGEQFIFSSTIKPAYNDDKKVMGVISLIEDVTMQRGKAKALKAFEDRWRFTFEKSNLGLWEWDMVSDLVIYSESYKKLYGFENNELKPTIQEWEIRVHPEDLALVKNAIDRHTNSEDAFFESLYRLQDKAGNYKWVLARGLITSRNKEGQPLYMIGSHTDITSQKEAEEQYKSLFFKHPIPMWIYDADNFHILEVNESALVFYGYTRKEFLNFTLYDLRSPDQCKALTEMIKDFPKDTAYKNVAQHIKKNGELFWGEFTGNFIEFQGSQKRLISLVDITANVLAEQELKKSNERFELAAKAAAEALWEWDIEKDHVYISPVYKEMFGHQINADRKYAEWHNYIHPDDKKQTIESFYHSINHAAINHWEKEYRYLKADGTYMYVIDRCIIIRNQSGKATKAVGAIQNVNKRKKAEEEILAINERFKLATKATSDAIYDWDLQTNDITWGEGIYTLFGYRSNISIKNWESCIHEADRQRIVQSLDYSKNQSKKKFWKEQYRFKKSDGNYCYVLDKGFLVRNADGKALRLIGAMQDITDLKLKERELINNNDRYKFATLATSEIIWDWNLVNGTILWSDNYQKILGWDLPPNKTLLDSTCKERSHPDDREKIFNSIQSAIHTTTKTLWHEEFRYRKADNSYAHVSTKGYVIRNAQGEAIRMIGAMEDISEKRYADSLLTLERKVFKLNASGNTSLKEVVDALLTGMEELYPYMFASVVLLEPNQTIKCMGGPRLPHKFLNGLNGLQIGPTEGSCGAAMFLKKTIIVADIATDPLWKKYKEFALAFNLKAAWSMPVFDRDENVMGCIAIYHKEIKKPTKKELQVIERFCDLLRILMENHLTLEKIKAANNRFDSVTEATHDLIWDWNLETGSFYRDKTGMKKVYGIEDESEISNIHSWMQKIHPDEHDKVQKIITNILHSSEEKSFDLEYRFRRDDGEYNYVYDRGYLIRNAAGKPVRMVGAAQNISERKKLEKDLLQRELDKQKLIAEATIQTQEQERSEIGKELHDNVNQVLTTTKLYLDLSVSNPELKDDLIQKSSKNIIYVINEIRQLSRSLMNPSLGDLGLIDSLTDLIENINLTRKLEVKLDTKVQEHALPESLKVTTFRIVQEVLNNAVKHAKASLVKIKLTANAEQLTLSVTDNGIGFQPKTVKRGTGLNSIQNRVYLANGTVTLESSPGKGCTILINLPLNKTNNPN